jgi:hypothetical protein
MPLDNENKYGRPFALHEAAARVLLLRRRVEGLALGAQVRALGDQVIDLLATLEDLRGCQCLEA